MVIEQSVAPIVNCLKDKFEVVLVTNNSQNTVCFMLKVSDELWVHVDFNLDKTITIAFQLDGESNNDYTETRPAPDFDTFLSSLQRSIRNYRGVLMSQVLAMDTVVGRLQQ